MEIVGRITLPRGTSATQGPRLSAGARAAMKRADRVREVILMKSKLVCLGTLLVLLTGACGAINPHVTDIPEETEDECSGACLRMAALQCDGYRGSPGLDEIWGTDDDISCFQACAHLISYPPIEMHAADIAVAESCEEIERLFQ